MAKSKAYITVVVSNLIHTVTREDVQAFFVAHWPNSEPVVKSWVRKSDNSRTATVTVKASNEAALREQIVFFQKTEFDRSPLNPGAGFSTSFLGLTPLYESSAEPPAFDVYFVHGLGGHAFNTWASKPESHTNVCMWPRDILPPYLELERDGSEQLYGRYSTFGFDATYWSGAEMEQSIPEAGQSLLNAISTSRAGDVPNNTPMFLVCHSLGGLVACEAVIKMLSKEKHRENFEEYLRDRFFHSHHGKCLLRGIAFFGTPFEGSWLADVAPILAPIGLHAGKGSFISALRVNDPQVQSIIKRFDDARREPQNRVRLAIFYEKKKLGKWILKTMVTEKKSALSTFDDKVDQAELLLDHRNIVKFAGESDRDFQQVVGPMIQFLVRSGLGEIRDFDMQWRAPFILKPDVERPVNTARRIAGIVPFSEEYEAEESETEKHVMSRVYMGAKSADSSPRSMLLRFGRSLEAEKVLKILLEGVADKDNTSFINKQLARVKNPIGDTCKWILDHQLYQEWENGASDEVLFVVGIGGSGKSVLSKFLTTHIGGQKPEAAIASFFCRSLGTSPTPANILRHVILQLDRQSQDLILKSLFDRPISSFAGQFDADILWKLFRDMCEKIGRNVYVIIDGLDECLQNIKLRKDLIESGIDHIGRFLEQVCSLSEVSTEASEKVSTSRVAICFLTRPQRQVDATTKAKNRVIAIEPHQVQKRAAQVIESETARLVEEEKLPPDLEAVVKENLLTKARETPESVFQWVNTAVERMQQSSGSTMDKLDAIHPGLYQVYNDILAQLSSKVEIKEVASFLFRTLVFSQKELELNELEHAFKINYNLKRDVAADEQPSMSILQVLDDVRGLVILQDGVVRLSHQSVRDHFQQLSALEWPDFSCINHDKGQIRMAMLCVECLTKWYRQDEGLENVVNELTSAETTNLQDLAASVSDQLPRNPFLAYSLDFWASHIRGVERLPEEVLLVLGRFLQEKNGTYRLTMALNASISDPDWSVPHEIKHPSFLLAEENLFNILRLVKFPSQKSTPRRSRSIFSRFGLTVPKALVENEPSYFQFQIDVKRRNSSASTLLHVAAKNGASEIVNYLLDLGALGNVFDTNGETPFSLAVFNNYGSIAEVLIRKGQAIERKYDPALPTSLHSASFFNMEKVVEFLLENNTNPNLVCHEENWTPSQVAADAGHENIVELLAKYGAIVDLATSIGWTALHFAAANNHTGTCQKLFSIKPDMDPSVQDEDGETPIYKAADRGHVAVVEFLLAQGADLRPETEDGYTPVHIAASRGHKSVIDVIANDKNVNERTYLSWQPIHLASRGGYTETVKALVKLGADPNSKMRDLAVSSAEEYTVTPLALAVIYNHRDLIEYFLDLCVKVKGNQSRSGGTLLHAAAAKGNVSLAKRLIIEHDLDPFEMSMDGETPFHAAASNGFVDMVKALWASPRHASQSIDFVDGDCATPLIRAAENHKMAVIEFCLKQGADPRKKSSLGLNSIHALFWADDVEEEIINDALLALLDNGGSLHDRGRQGVTALHLAAKPGRVDSVVLLLQKGADGNAISWNGNTPLHDAACNRAEEVFSVLLKLGSNPLLRNEYGFTCLDYASKYKPILELPELQDQLNCYRPLDRAEQIACMNKQISKSLSERVELHDGPHRGLEEMDLCGDLSYKCFLNDREEDARIFFEHAVQRTASNRAISLPPCSKCKRYNQDGPIWICRDCRPVWVRVCNSCYEKRSTEGVFRGCSIEHSHMEVAGRYWKELEPGTVRKDGHTITQWRENLRKEFGVVMPAPEEDTQTPAGQTSMGQAPIEPAEDVEVLETA